MQRDRAEAWAQGPGSRGHRARGRGLGGAGDHGHHACHDSVCLHACLCVWAYTHVFYVYIHMYMHAMCYRGNQCVCIACMYYMHCSCQCVCMCEHVPCVCVHRSPSTVGWRQGQPGLSCGTLARRDLARAGERDGGFVIKEERVGAHPAQEYALRVEGQGAPSPAHPELCHQASRSGGVGWGGQGHSVMVTLLSWASSSTKQH